MAIPLWPIRSPATRAVCYCCYCSFILTLSLLALATVVRSDGSPHLHHVGAPILAGPAWSDPELSKQASPPTKPCPTGANCVLHKSGVYLAVTSIGEGFPRVQYTCTQTMHPHPTHAYQQQQPETSHSSFSPSSAQQRPPQLLLLPDVTKQQQDNHVHKQKLQERTEESRLFSSGPLNTPRATPHKGFAVPAQMKDDLTKSLSDDFLLPQYDYVFSPRQRSSPETGIHTTTQTYSDGDTAINDCTSGDSSSSRQGGIGDVPTAGSIPLTSGSTVRHHQRDMDLRSSIRQMGSVSSSISNREALTTPEPMATLATPTFDAVSSSNGDRKLDENLYAASKEKARLLAGQDTAPRSHPQLKQGHGAEGHMVKRMRHRVTTLIIETETIIAPAHPTHS